MIRIKDNNTSITKNAIVERLIYSFDFNYTEARMELDFLFATANILHTEEYYTTKIRRIGSSKLLNRGQRMDVYKHVVACIEENNA
jgi:hypothetical protein